MTRREIIENVVGLVAIVVPLIAWLYVVPV